MFIHSKFHLLFSLFLISSTLNRYFTVVLLLASFHVHLCKFVKILWSLDGYISEENLLTLVAGPVFCVECIDILRRSYVFIFSGREGFRVAICTSYRNVEYPVFSIFRNTKPTSMKLTNTERS